MKQLTICIVQPVLSPYWHNRLKVLAQYRHLEIILLLEQASLAHRPGWKVAGIEGIYVDVIGSTVLKQTIHSDDLGYQVKNMRSIPWKLFFKLWRLRPDIVILCNATQTLFSLPLKYIFGLKLALLVEDTPHARRNTGAIVGALKAWVYRRCNHFFPFSSDAVTFLGRIGVTGNVSRSSWSLDMKSFKPKNVMVQTNHGKPKTVIFVGSLIEGKGILQLLEAWKQLPEKVRSKAQLLVVGSGVLEGTAKSFVNNNKLYEIKLMGQIDYATVCVELKNSDLFILPTLQDLFSLTVLEAMACGCPVITTPYNGARELVENDKTGWIIDPNNIGEMTKVILHALSEKCDLAVMGKRARLRVEKMDNKIVMDQFLKDLYKLKEQ